MRTFTEPSKETSDLRRRSCAQDLTTEEAAATSNDRLRTFVPRA